MAMDGATVTMSMREADRLKTVQAVVDGALRVGVAAQRLGLSRRQLERLLQRYKAKVLPASPHAAASRRWAMARNSVGRCPVCFLKKRPK